MRTPILKTNPLWLRVYEDTHPNHIILPTGKLIVDVRMGQPERLFQIDTSASPEKSESKKLIEVEHNFPQTTVPPSSSDSSNASGASSSRNGLILLPFDCKESAATNNPKPAKSFQRSRVHKSAQNLGR